MTDTLHNRALEKARAAYIKGVRANEGPTAAVTAIIEAYTSEMDAQRRAKRLPPHELLAKMPGVVRTLVREVCAKHDVLIDLVLGQRPMGHRGLRTRIAACRREIWLAMREAGYTYPQIAVWFQVDHSTVQYAVKKWPRPRILRRGRMPASAGHA